MASHDAPWVLCGSCTNLHATLVKLICTHKVPISDAIKMLSCNPAAVAKLQRGGSIQEGQPCDVVLLGSSPTYAIRWTIVGGRVVFDEGERRPCKRKAGHP